jgi:hypothetical protein
MNIIEDANKFFKSLRDDKNTMMFLIISMSVITVWVKPSQLVYDLFDNKIFKFVIFVIISFISNENPALAVLLIIYVLTVLQIITYNNLSKHEEFKHINMKSGFEDYLDNPLLTQDDLNPITSNLNLKVENPDQVFKNMIKKGRVLLNDSIEINDDLEKRPDSREKKICEITKRDGINLVESGLNRLQVSNQGEYNLNKNNNNNKFVKYNNLLKNYMNDPQIMSAFNELKYNFNKLQSDTLSKNNTDNFNEQLSNVYESEVQLLELIYKNKKDNIIIENQNEINNIFNNIKNIKLNKNIMDKYPILLENIKILVEYLS